MDSGPTPNLLRTASSSMSMRRLLSRHTTLDPSTSCAMSLSGEQTTTCSTSGRSFHLWTAAAMASSASNSTIGQTTSPRAAAASSARSNCAARSSGTPEPSL